MKAVHAEALYELLKEIPAGSAVTTKFACDELGLTKQQFFDAKPVVMHRLLIDGEGIGLGGFTVARAVDEGGAEVLGSASAKEWAWMLTDNPTGDVMQFTHGHRKSNLLSRTGTLLLEVETALKGMPGRQKEAKQMKALAKTIDAAEATIETLDLPAGAGIGSDVPNQIIGVGAELAKAPVPVGSGG